MSEQRHFVNLTNGLEWCAELPYFSFVRVESTTIEKGDLVRLMRDLDANFLMCLALGLDCHFYDCVAQREISKTVSVGIPIIRDTLKQIWFGREPPAYDKSSQEMKRKIRYFKRYTSNARVLLTGHSRSTSHDGDVAYYAGVARSLPNGNPRKHPLESFA